jgi:hypothetical protein
LVHDLPAAHVVNAVAPAAE